MASAQTYRLLLKYNIRLDQQENYYRYMIGEFVPMMQDMGLTMLFVWQVYGDNYPERQVEFVCNSLLVMQGIIASDKFLEAEARLKDFTDMYSRKVVRFKNRFQF